MTEEKLTLKKQIRAAILEIYPEWEDESIIEENLKIVNASQELESLGLINFSVEYRESDDHSWLQSEYYSKPLRKTIILDYDWPSYIESDDEIVNEDDETALDKLVRYFAEEENNCEALETKLKNAFELLN